MTIDEIKAMVSGEEYDFLRSDPHLGSNIIFLTLGGSYAYGTNVDTSDVDIRGCALNRPCDMIGLSSFEQSVHTATDTTVYAFNKLVSLLLNCNPNVIEMLGCKPEHYISITDTGLDLLRHKDMFLSRRAVHSFGGYANSQLRRLENALARDRVSQAKREEHILHSMESAMAAFDQRYHSFDGSSIRLFMDESEHEELDKEIFADITLSHYPVREFNGIMNDLTTICGCYDKLNHRNNKKDDNHLNKHAMHLVRLFLMALDILEKKQIVTYREKDRDLLMSIRGGAYQNEDGSYKSEFFDLINDLEKKLKYAAENTDLPDHPNMKTVEEYVMHVNYKCVRSRNEQDGV